MNDLNAIFDEVYRTDLVYVPDCWKLCGDAHCCSFMRYKSRFRILAQTDFQELPLLPGEFDYLADQGWLAQFEPYQRRRQSFVIDGRTVWHDCIVSQRPGCACNHATRPTICRLYPLMPCFDVDGALVGVEDAGIYEALEQTAGLPRVCRIEAVPLNQLTPFMNLASALARSPLLRFHLEAYRLTRLHVAERVAQRYGQSQGRDVFRVFEGLMLRAQLVDKPILTAALTQTMQRFDARWPGWDASLRGDTAQAMEAAA
jgi:hypothetical protein